MVRTVLVAYILRLLLHTVRHTRCTHGCTPPVYARLVAFYVGSPRRSYAVTVTTHARSTHAFILYYVRRTRAYLHYLPGPTPTAPPRGAVVVLPFWLLFTYTRLYGWFGYVFCHARVTFILFTLPVTVYAHLVHVCHCTVRTLYVPAFTATRLHVTFAFPVHLPGYALRCHFGYLCLRSFTSSRTLPHTF